MTHARQTSKLPLRACDNGQMGARIGSFEARRSFEQELPWRAALELGRAGWTAPIHRRRYDARAHR